MLLGASLVCRDCFVSEELRSLHLLTGEIVRGTKLKIKPPTFSSTNFWNAFPIISSSAILRGQPSPLHCNNAPGEEDKEHPILSTADGAAPPLQLRPVLDLHAAEGNQRLPVLVPHSCTLQPKLLQAGPSRSTPILPKDQVCSHKQKRDLPYEFRKRQFKTKAKHHLLC